MGKMGLKDYMKKVSSVEIHIIIIFLLILAQVMQVFLLEPLLPSMESLEIAGIRDSLKPVYCAGDWKAQTLCLCQQPHDNVNRGDAEYVTKKLIIHNYWRSIKNS